MSFKRLETDDFVVSADSISSTLWSTGNPILSAFFTSSIQSTGSSGLYYLNVFDTAATSSVQFAVTYGNKKGSGSLVYNTAVDGKSPSSTIYGQYQNLVIGDENTDFIFGAITSSEFFAIAIERSRYKEKLFLGSMTLFLTGSSGSIYLTDNSAYASSVRFNEAGRVYQLITGSAGTRATISSRNTTDGYSANSGSYGWFLPDVGLIILNPKALSDYAVSGGIGLLYSGSNSASATPTEKPFNSLFKAISGSSAPNSGSFKLNSEETITSDYIFIRPRSSEFNYSENPSFISGSTGEILYSSFINNPQVYITTVGLYNDNNELLAVAKLSRPLVKDFTKEALLRCKLDF